MNVRQEAERNRVDLELLIKKGKGDDDEADTLRERYGFLVLQLSPNDRALLKELSGDLDSLSGREIPEGREGTTFKEDLAVSMQREDVPEFMRLIRVSPSAIEPWRTAFLRSIGWSLLGFKHAARAFAEHSTELLREELNLK